MLEADFKKHILKFNFPGGTSRGVLYEKPSWYLRLRDDNGKTGIGEISVIPGLSPDEESHLDEMLPELCSNINTIIPEFHTKYKSLPALRFGIEMALQSLQAKSTFELFESSFTICSDSIKINGLIWMGDIPNMNRQIESKLEQGFSCLKMKIGALNFEDELKVLQGIRQRFSKDVLEIRVDANGSFQMEDTMNKLDQLAALHLHSIEQPIKAGQWEKMSEICSKTPLPIALDEELIGVHDSEERNKMLSLIKPQYIILKPSLTGGFASSTEWIKLAEERRVGWWVTSALEGNIGLNAIAQWVYTLNNKMPQGLGTGQVFGNNIESPLYLKGDNLNYNPTKSWVNPFDE
ncbi:o-succinylbenzoate synthase [Carboxylicivirga caseinilyticus]|uniref:o-succinylbenzoate synthase n=1 Tax=Carboxylicivirga caseinilyticus TaxID=3417572 RepID=UPI003D357F12|nr:o-succinylbenzoate synthase [Marinilabiliaceae bacterium A049]